MKQRHGRNRISLSLSFSFRACTVAAAVLCLRAEIKSQAPGTQSVAISSTVDATVVGIGPVSLRLAGAATHTTQGQTVIFNQKRLIGTLDPLGTIRVSLDPSRESRGTLTGVPGVHRQEFFVAIETAQLGRLISDVALVQRADILDTPPTAQYRSEGEPVDFYRDNDPQKNPVLTVTQVVSDVSPLGATEQQVAISSVVDATVVGVGDVSVNLGGIGSHSLINQSVLFSQKFLIGRLDPLGPIRVSLDPDQLSVGLLTGIPGKHTQSFFVKIDAGSLGRLVADDPLVLEADVDINPPNAQYKSDEAPVDYYKEGDIQKATVLTVNRVVSDVSPPGIDPQPVAISSTVDATIAGVGAVSVNLAGIGIHFLANQSVLFTQKALIGRLPPVGPIRVTLDPKRLSVGLLEDLPGVHYQSFFVRIDAGNLGRLVADAPLILQAQIEVSPPKAQYLSDGGPVDFYKEGDAQKATVLTINKVVSDVEPPGTTSQQVAISSVVAATIPGVGKVSVGLAGIGSHTLVNQSVLFTQKSLAGTIDPIGPIRATLDPEQLSVGLLTGTPGTHYQSFFLKIDAGNLGRLVSETPLVLQAEIAANPPTARYTSDGGPIDFYKEGDAQRTTVLTVDGVVSDVAPPSTVEQAVAISSDVTATVTGIGDVSVTLTGTASHFLVGQSVLFNKKTLSGKTDPLGSIELALDPERPSVGILDGLPGKHHQTFFVTIDAGGRTLVADEPVLQQADIVKSPPDATYQSVGGPVDFYEKGDIQKKTVLTLKSVTSMVTPPPPPPSTPFHRGDADDNGDLQLTDAIRILGYLFLGGAEPTCLDAADADDNGVLQLTDAVRILGYLFLGGAPPAPPGPPPNPCGPDPGRELGCVFYNKC